MRYCEPIPVAASSRFARCWPSQT